MTRRIRLAGVHIALAAMLLRALLPAGWMPNSAPSAGAPFVICAMDGAAHLASGSDGQPLKHQPDQNNDRSHEMCPFAAAPHLATPSKLSVLPRPSLAPSTVPNTLYGDRTEDVGRDTPQSPRGPPTFV
jgi:hypothetical protein